MEIFVADSWLIKKLATALAVGACVLTANCGEKRVILNASYDPTRELYQEYNKVFVQYWREKTGEELTVLQSHGGSGKQARAVIDGLDADVVTLALAYDIDAIAEHGRLLPMDWQKRLPNNSAPYTSTIVFLVRKGNPKGIKDWDDLARPGIKVITPNPKSSGGARWSYLAAWGYALRKFENSDFKAREFVASIYRNVPILDSGARSAATTFMQRGIGDVLITWENEAFLAIRENKSAAVELVAPSLSIVAEPPVAVVEWVARKKGNLAVARAYLGHLYSEAGQEIAARNYYRPRLESVGRKYAAQFPTVNLFTLEEVFGSWAAAQKKHFAEGGVFDEMLRH